MLPYYAYHALNQFVLFNAGDDQLFNERYSANTLFLSSTDSIPSFNNLAMGGRGSDHGDQYAISAIAVYTPRAINEYILNPTEKTTEPTHQDYLWRYETGRTQALVDATSWDSIHAENRTGVRLLDNYMQLLDVLNSLRYTRALVYAIKNLKNYYHTTRIGDPIEWKVSNFYDGSVYTEQLKAEYIYYTYGVIHESYYTFDIDFSFYRTGYYSIPLIRDPYLLKSIRLFKQEYSSNAIGGTDPEYNKYDTDIVYLEDGDSDITIRTSARSSPGTNFSKFYRAATEIRPFTMKELADYYQVPY